MTIIVIVIAGPAPDFCRLSIDQRDNRMVRNPAAFYAMIVDDIA